LKSEGLIRLLLWWKDFALPFLSALEGGITQQFIESRIRYRYILCFLSEPSQPIPIYVLLLFKYALHWEVFLRLVFSGIGQGVHIIIPCNPICVNLF
jgi:hypothetical protein